MPKQYIKIRGANEHNLKNISLDIPRNELVVLTAAWQAEKPGNGKKKSGFRRFSLSKNASSRYARAGVLVVSKKK